MGVERIDNHHIYDVSCNYPGYHKETEHNVADRAVTEIFEAFSRWEEEFNNVPVKLILAKEVNVCLRLQEVLHDAED
jgi:hypothetical protein